MMPLIISNVASHGLFVNGGWTDSRNGVLYIMAYHEFHFTCSSVIAVIIVIVFMNYLNLFGTKSNTIFVVDHCW